jgi:hypothetical protein
MRALLLVILFLIAMPQFADARIGETLEQCAKRYGEQQGRPVERMGCKVVVFERKITYKSIEGKLKTTCAFKDGKCVAIHFYVNPSGAYHPVEVKELIVHLENKQTSKNWVPYRGSREFPLGFIYFVKDKKYPKRETSGGELYCWPKGGSTLVSISDLYKEQLDEAKKQKQAVAAEKAVKTKALLEEL